MIENIARILSIFREKAYSPLTRRRPLRRGGLITRDALYEHAKEVAASHAVRPALRSDWRLYRRFTEITTAVQDAHRALTEAARTKERLTPGAEWLLDNYHVIQEQTADIKRDFPRTYEKTLPRLGEGAYEFFPRVYQLVLDFLEHTDLVLDTSLLSAYVRGYQTATPLTIGELWAVPIMLRFALIEHISALSESFVAVLRERKVAEQLVDEILADSTRPSTEILLVLARRVVEHPEFVGVGSPYLLRRLREKGRKAELALGWLEERLRENGTDPEESLRSEQYFLAADQLSIGNAVTSLRAVGFINWKDWFESLSAIHQTLLSDPAGIYGKCDFETRDRCRQAVEKLARKSNRLEADVAAAAIQISEEANREDLANTKREDPNVTLLGIKHSHVGYYLLDKGRASLESKIGFKPSKAEEFGRYILAHPFPFYAGWIVLATALIVLVVLQYLVAHHAGTAACILAGLLLFIPASDIATNLVQWLITATLKPAFLPKLELPQGVPPEAKTIVVVHSIFNDRESVGRTIDGLEVRYLANPEKNVTYGVLADFADSENEVRASDAEILEYARTHIFRLNANHGADRFFILFRKRVWNENEQRWMGWERKRGKLEEFNRLLRGGRDTSFLISDEEFNLLGDVRYVLTLDNDSQLPHGVVRRLVGTALHPLNAPIYDSRTRRVLEGYSIFQPRMGTSLQSANSSLFAKIFSGNAGLDPYTQTISEVYQDFFSEGSYIGKGLYDVRAFARALEGRVPENALLSHDLFEGLFARGALVSDIELFDDFPVRYHVHARRQHRWVRGDWQLLPWIWRVIPNWRMRLTRNPLSALGRWKLMDNLRRSLVAPSVYALLIMIIGILPGSLWYWGVLLMCAIAFPIYTNIAQAFIVSRQRLSAPGRFSLKRHVQVVGKDSLLILERAVFTLCFLPHQVALMTHAIVVTIYRLVFTRKHLLEWETAAHTGQRLDVSFKSFFKEMWPGVAIAAFALIFVAVVNPSAITYTSPLFLLWFAAPFIAKDVSETISHEVGPVSSDTREYLWNTAWDTWRYFRDLVSAERNFLVPDNLQLIPDRRVAERTSPTNISLSLLATIAAHDLGFAAMSIVIARLKDSFQNLAKLERYRGHFLNWYDTKTLESLRPRYVSMVDSGNMVGHLIAIRTAAHNFTGTGIVTAAHIEQLGRIAGLLLEKIEDRSADFTRKVEELLAAAKQPITDPLRTIEVLELARVVMESIDSLNESGKRKAGSLKQDLEDLLAGLPFISWIRDYAAIRNSLPINNHSAKIDGWMKEPFPSFRVLGVFLTAIEDDLATVEREDVKIFKGVVRALKERLARERSTVAGLLKEIDGIIRAMDFTFLFDPERELFAIGYHLDSAKRDQSYYDLLASEARLGSLVAIALGQIPHEHWFSLGRPLTDAHGERVLISWSGTMFEYMMPLLVTREYPGTLLSETYKAVAKIQQAYGKSRRVPWGISESSYAGVDYEKTYQYRAFGVPGIGLKRGLEHDLVVSPYSTILALPYGVSEAVKNLHELEKEGGRGEYGFYEAIDYTTTRLGEKESHHVVQSFFAHHQGMSLVALTNFLCGGLFQKRFHDDARIRAVELLLQERFPESVPTIKPEYFIPAESAGGAEGQEGSAVVQVISTPHTVVPRTHLVSNGRYAVMVDNAGSGFSTLSGEIALTRWKEDPVSNLYGSYIFFKDVDTGNIWSSSYLPTAVEGEAYDAIFTPDKAEFKRRDFDIFSHTEITVSPEDDVEVRRVSLTNLSAVKRTIEITSYGEVVLSEMKADAAHPAFSKLFLSSEFIPDSDALIYTRRKRSDKERDVVFFHSLTMRTVWARTQFETSRAAFIGRGRTLRDAEAIRIKKSLSGSIGNVLDPIFSLRARIEIEPGETQTLHFISGAAQKREQAVGLIQRYHELYNITRAFEMAWSKATIELKNEEISPRRVQLFQRLGNAVLFGIEGLQAPAEVRAKNMLSQPNLWRFGISGDVPVVLAEISDPEHISIVRDLLGAHQYLRGRGVIFDLLILNQQPGGYLQNVQDEVKSLVHRSSSGYLEDKKGGIFVRGVSQLSEDERTLFESLSRVVIHGERGPLASQLKWEDKAYEPVQDRPLIVAPTRAGTHELGRMEFENSYGGFIENGRGYRVNVGQFFPPVPYSNVIANPQFGFLITESGGGYTWTENSREHRLTPWCNDPVSDPLGEAIFIRDVESGEYWSPTPRPVASGGVYRVEHRPGYSEFFTEIDYLESSLTVFAAKDEKVKCWKLNLKNHAKRKRRIELCLYVEWVMGVSRDETARFIVTGFDPQSHCMFARNTYSTDFRGKIGFIGSSEEIESYTGSKLEFVGRNRTLARPLVLEEARSVGQAAFRAPTGAISLSQSVGVLAEPVGVIKVSVEIAAGGSSDVNFFLGEAQSIEEVRKLSTRWSVPEGQTRGHRESQDSINKMLQAVEISTPDRGFDLLMNNWLLFQTQSCRINGRTGFYQSGGAFGFRDQLQDVLALLIAAPEAVRSQILLHSSRQFVQGDVQHWWHPPSGKGVRTKISDDFLWLPYVTARYLTATGDSSVLEERVAFVDAPPLTESEHEIYTVPTVTDLKASVYEHCLLALERGLHMGAHGIPLMGAGDWNDGMNHVGRHGRGESIWLGWFLIAVLKEFIPIIKARGDLDRVARYEAICSSVAESIEKHAWSGSWYLRAYFDDGSPLGSPTNDECQIDSIAQTWGVISGAAQPDRVRKALESVHARLVDKDAKLIKLFDPPFEKSALEPGYVKGYPPGVRENGGQYTHAAVWLIIAHAILGDGNAATELFSMINPINHGGSKAGGDKYLGEPYVLAGDVYGRPPHTGRCGWSWYTGSAGWMYQAGLEYILGLKVRGDSFTVAPVIPSTWKECGIVLRRGGTTFRIKIENPTGAQSGVRSISVNGAVLSGLDVRFADFAGVREVSVVVGM